MGGSTKKPCASGFQLIRRCLENSSSCSSEQVQYCVPGKDKSEDGF